MVIKIMFYFYLSLLVFFYSGALAFGSERLDLYILTKSILKNKIISTQDLIQFNAKSQSLGFEGISNPAANLSNTPIEVLESQQPVQITKYAFVKNSGGPGKNRGGMALVRAYRLLETEAELVMRSDRRTITPYGLKGGLPGTPSWNIIRSRNKKILLPVCPMSAIKMVKNDEFIHIQAGGGGFGNPLQRNPKKVLNDFLNDLIDKDYAEQVYGVIISKNKVDKNETILKRKILFVILQLYKKVL